MFRRKASWVAVLPGGHEESQHIATRVIARECGTGAANSTVAREENVAEIYVNLKRRSRESALRVSNSSFRTSLDVDFPR